ncbi:MAG: PEGA domain-containing protein [Deltaproteobacteria bacterium]|nr:PEGA domain-containing protein [Deltaproteobacteria bacterium]
MIKIRTIGASFLVVAMQAAAAPLVWAGATEDAAALKAKADDAFDGRRFAEALVSYRAAIEKNRDARLHYNIAQALAALERYPEALTSYQAFIAEAPSGTLNEAQQAQLFALVEALKAKIARISIQCDVPGARVLVRGKIVGVTPLPSAVVVNAGEAKIEVIAEGYKAFEATMTLAGGTTRPVVIRLERVDFTGFISVRSNVAGAQVLVDGMPAGTAPLEVRVKRGTHHVEVKASDHVSQSRIATVEPGARTQWTATLDRAPNYTLAYVGFAVGAVGLGVGTYTGLTARARFNSAKTWCDMGANECGPAARDDLNASKLYGNLSTISFGVGVAGLGLGAYSYWSARRAVRPKQVDVGFGPGSLIVQGAF